MQKFGLDSLIRDKHSALELEIAKEQATALGIAGNKLKESIEEYRASSAMPLDEDLREAQIRNISERFWALILQREFVGLVHENVDWIKKHYEIPNEVFALFGTSPRNR